MRMTDDDRKALAVMLSQKSTLAPHDSESLLRRCEWNLDVAMAFWTLAMAYNRDVFYVFERSRWLRDC